VPVFVDRIAHGHHLFERVQQDGAGPPADAITIGLVNNMPDGALVAAERQVFELLRAAAPEAAVRLKFYALPSVVRSEWGREYVGRSHYGLGELLGDRLDAIIVTGAEPQTPELADEAYWPELGQVIDWAQGGTTSAIWSCLAVHAAVLHLDCIHRQSLPEKCIGIFAQERLGAHAMLQGAPSHLPMPHSRWNEIREADLGACGYQVLTRSRDAGVDLFVKPLKGSLFAFFQGHPEYEATSLLGEYRRDIGRYLRREADGYPTMPKGYFAEPVERELARFRAEAMADRRPEVLTRFPVERLAADLKNTWQSAATCIYRNWLGYLQARRP
jgi:homoserine O-succinyltransferase